MSQIRLWILSSLFLTFIPIHADALYTEVGFSYSYMKRTIDSLNGHESQSTTGSVSLYFWEKLAFELSHTRGLFIKKEREESLTSPVQRQTTQESEVSELNLIYLITERKVKFQPYIKGGVAQIKKKQSVFTDGVELYSLPIDPVMGPSYGIGAKYFFTEEIALRMSYDVVRTPIDNSATSEDVSVRVGFSWVL